MKTKIISSIKKVQVPSLVSGIVIGLVFGYVATLCISYPGNYYGTHKNAKYAGEMSEGTSESYRDMKYHMNGTNPFMMNKVTSEKQYLQDMKLHHDAAVLMSQQVLQIKGVHQESLDLAKNIIEAQTMEIKMMQDWMTAWGY